MQEEKQASFGVRRNLEIWWTQWACGVCTRLGWNCTKTSLSWQWRTSDLQTWGGILNVCRFVFSQSLDLAEAHIEEELNITQPQVAAAHKWLQSSEPSRFQRAFQRFHLLEINYVCIKNVTEYSEYWSCWSWTTHVWMMPMQHVLSSSGVLVPHLLGQCLSSGLDERCQGQHDKVLQAAQRSLCIEQLPYVLYLLAMLVYW